MVEQPADNDAVYGHVLAGNLEPTTGGSTQVDGATRGFEKGILFVELDELEGRPCTIALLSVLCEEMGLNGTRDAHFASL